MDNWHVHSNHGVLYDHDHSDGELQDPHDVHSHGRLRDGEGFDFDSWERLGQLVGKHWEQPSGAKLR